MFSLFISYNSPNLQITHDLLKPLLRVEKFHVYFYEVIDFFYNRNSKNVKESREYLEITQIGFQRFEPAHTNNTFNLNKKDTDFDDNKNNSLASE